MNETDVVDPIDESLFPRCRRDPSNLEHCPGVFLREHPDRLVIGSGDPERLVGHQLDAPTGCGPLEFKHHGGFTILSEDHINPIKRAACWGSWVGDPVANPSVIFVFIQAPRNTVRNQLPAFHVGRMIAHAKACEIFPPSGIFIPEILDSSISGLRKGTSFSQAPYPDRDAFRIEDGWIAKNWLPKNFG